MNPKRLVDAVPVLLAGWITLLVGRTWAARLLYPYDLEWMEGGMVAHAWRVQHWLPLYTEPDATWIPYIYPPGYPSAVAALGLITGVSAPTGRVVSVIGSLLACGALVFGVQRQTRGIVGGLLGMGLFLSCYVDSGGFYDLVRPDALAIGLLSWAIVLAMESSPKLRLLGALLLASAFTVKHNTAAFGVPLALGIWAQRGWRPALAFGLGSAVPAGLFTVVLQVTTGGHFLTTLLDIPGAHPMVLARLVPGTVEETAKHVGVSVVVVTGLFLLGTLRGLSGWRRWAAGVLAVVGALGVTMAGIAPGSPRGMAVPPWYAEWAVWLCVGACLGASSVALTAWRDWRLQLDGRWVFAAALPGVAILVTGLMRAHHGGFLNVYIPLHWVLAFSAGVGLEWTRRTWSHWAVWVVGAALFTGQLYLKMDIEPERYSPNAADVAAGDAFVELLRDCDGPVLSPYAPWLPALAGHEPSFHLIALWDIHHRDGPYRDQVPRVREAAEQHYWACVVDGGARQPLQHGISKNYKLWKRPTIRPVQGRKGPPTFMPRTGWRARPTSILVPKDSP